MKRQTEVESGPTSLGAARVQARNPEGVPDSAQIVAPIDSGARGPCAGAVAASDAAKSTALTVALTVACCVGPAAPGPPAQGSDASGIADLGTADRDRPGRGDAGEGSGDSAVTDVADGGATDGGEGQPGRIVAVEDGPSASRAALQELVPPEVRIQSGYSLHRITFETGARQARLVVAVPSPLPDLPLHAVLHAPGTTGLADACALAESEFGYGLAGLYGARGLVGAVLDPPGRGTPGDAPYLDRPIWGRAVLNGLRALARFGEQRGLPQSGRSAVTGFSRGGHAALAAAQLQPRYAPDLDLRGVAVVAPSSGWVEHWRPGLGFAGDHLVYHALLTWAWRRQEPFPEPWAAEVAPQIDGWMQERCAFPPPEAPAVTLRQVLPRAPEDLFAPEFRTAWRSGEWGRFVRFGELFAAHRLGPVATPVPIRVYQGDADAVVLEPWTRELVTALRQGPAAVDYRVVPGGRHSDIAFGFLAVPQRRTEEGLRWIRERLASDP